MIYSVVIEKFPTRYSILVCRASWTLNPFDILLNINLLCTIYSTLNFNNWCLFQVVGDADTSLPKLMDELGLYLKHFCCCCWQLILCMCCLNKNVSVSMTIMLWQKITFTQETKKRFCCIFTLHSFSFRYSFVKVRDADEYQTIT